MFHVLHERRLKLSERNTFSESLLSIDASLIYPAEVKILLLLLLLLLLVPFSGFAESRAIVIVGHVIGEQKGEAFHIKGHSYSLLSDLKRERVTEGSLEELTAKLPLIKNSGSIVSVVIQSDRWIPSWHLSKILEAMSKNAYLELRYLEGGIDASFWGKNILKNYGVESHLSASRRQRLESGKEMR